MLNAPLFAMLLILMQKILMDGIIRHPPFPLNGLCICVNPQTFARRARQMKKRTDAAFIRFMAAKRSIDSKIRICLDVR